MSVTAGLNRPFVIGGIVALVLALVVTAVALTRSGAEPATPGARLRAVSEPLDVIASRTPAESSVEVSRRFFASSPAAVLTAPDADSMALATDAAATLDVPVLVDGDAAVEELARLGATTVLTAGRTRAMPDARAVPLTAEDADRVVTRVARDVGRPQGESSGAVVVTRSRAANAAAVATARVAGADVLELPTADAREPGPAKALAARPKAPVVALGTPFTEGFAYTLDVVRSGATQPSGGYLAMPGKHYTAMYGHPGAPQLGVLGEQGVKASVERVKRLAAKYEAVGDGTFVPTFEVIATVASAGAGKDKDYSRETPVKDLQPLVDAAGEAGVYVILDLQPGRSDFLKQAKRYESLLRLPHVGLALDPEWRLKKGQKHLRQIGSVKAAEVNRVADWLATLTRKHSLPQKVFVLHQFSGPMITGRDRLDTSHPELATVIHVDGHGTQPAKKGTWDLLREDAPAGVHWGWKNFVDEDEPMLSARQTWKRVRPHPDLVTYQ